MKSVVMNLGIRVPAMLTFGLMDVTTYSRHVAKNSEGLTQAKVQREQVRNMKLSDRLLMRKYPDGCDGLSALGDGAYEQTGAARLPATATVHANF